MQPTGWHRIVSSAFPDARHGGSDSGSASPCALRPHALDGLSKLWQQPSRRHLSFFYALSGLTGAQTGFYVALWRQIDAMPWLLLSIGLMMILIVIALSRISMRLVNDVLEGQGGMTAPYLARPPRRHLATWSIALFSLAEFLLPGHTSTGWLALAAAAALLNLLNDWHVGRALWQRWVMIPYLVYWLMAAGYALIGLGLLTNSNWNSAGHHLLSHAIEKNHRFRPLAGHGQGCDHGHPEQAGTFCCGRQLGMQTHLHLSAMLAHPQHHLGNQAGGNEQRGGLEDLQRFAGQLILYAQQRPTQHQGQSDTRRQSDEQGALA